MDQGAMDDTAKSAKVSVEPTPTTSNRIFLISTYRQFHLWGNPHYNIINLSDCTHKAAIRYHIRDAIVY